jgi:hypothetical protein
VSLHELTTNQKGLIAENAIIRQAILHGIGVFARSMASVTT